MKDPVRYLVAAAAALSAASCATLPPASLAADPSLDEARAATARFKDVNVALREGYVRDPMDHCVTAPEMGLPASAGAMGVHYINPAMLGLIPGAPTARVNGTGTHTDFRNPAILIYEPQADGSLELVAIENLVFRKSWHAAGHAAPPSYLGVPYDPMTDDPATALDEAHMFEPHYDRHVWLYRANPKGVFTPFNPAVSCAHHKPAHAHSG
ncbi:MAG TPA: hypothetical protein VNA29_06870 [Sphingomicrobium sp.]|nr:hypothetical protein [Sphingomicrobium sp.]